MAKQSSKPRVKVEEASRENIEEDLRAPYLNCSFHMFLDPTCVIKYLWPQHS